MRRIQVRKVARKRVFQQAAKETTQNSPDLQKPEGAAESEYPPLLDYLQTKEGHELASRLVSLFEGIQKATIEAGAEQKKKEVEFQHSTVRLWMKLQAGAITVIIIAAGVLAWHGKLDATVATLMATLFGYFLGEAHTIDVAGCGHASARGSYGIRIQLICD